MEELLVKLAHAVDSVSTLPLTEVTISDFWYFFIGAFCWFWKIWFFASSLSIFISIGIAQFYHLRQCYRRFRHEGLGLWIFESCVYLCWLVIQVPLDTSTKITDDILNSVFGMEANLNNFDNQFNAWLAARAHG